MEQLQEQSQCLRHQNDMLMQLLRNKGGCLKSATEAKMVLLPIVTPNKQQQNNYSVTSALQVDVTWATTLINGATPHKRKPALTQIAAISQEYKRREEEQGVVGVPIEFLCNKGLLTLEDYWDFYKAKWKPLELATDGEWWKGLVVDEEGKRRRGCWWTQRVGMFKVIEHHMSMGLSEEETIKEAKVIFQSATSRAGKKALNVAFKKEMD